MCRCKISISMRKKNGESQRTRHLKMALGHQKDVTLVYKVMSKKFQDINPLIPELHFTKCPSTFLQLEIC